MRTKLSIHEKIGLAGVSEYENPRARLFYKVARTGELLIIIGLAVQWYMETVGTMKHFESHIYNVLIWGYFILETAILTLLVNERKQYLSENILKLSLIVLGLPLALGANIYGPLLLDIRLALIVLLLTPWLEDCRRSLSDNNLGTTVVAASFIIVLSGIFIAGVDPAVHNVREGIWWAWVTVTTVGYGDIVPVSNIGRTFAALLMMVALGLFAVFTANFSAIFLQRRELRDFKKESQDIRRILNNTRQLRQDSEDMTLLITAIEKRLSRLEQSQQKLPSQDDDLN